MNQQLSCNHRFLAELDSKVRLYFDVTSVKLVFVSDKIDNVNNNFRINWLSYGKISAILCVLLLFLFVLCCLIKYLRRRSIFSVFTLFYLILENMSNNVRKFWFPCYIYDTCDVVYNWSISLLPPIDCTWYSISAQPFQEMKFVLRD